MFILWVNIYNMQVYCILGLTLAILYERTHSSQSRGLKEQRSGRAKREGKEERALFLRNDLLSGLYPSLSPYPPTNSTFQTNFLRKGEGASFGWLRPTGGCDKFKKKATKKHMHTRRKLMCGRRHVRRKKSLQKPSLYR